MIPSSEAKNQIVTTLFCKTRLLILSLYKKQITVEKSSVFFNGNVHVYIQIDCGLLLNIAHMLLLKENVICSTVTN